MNWIGRLVSLPDNVGAALQPLLGVQVHRVRVIEHSLFVRLHGRALATTRRGSIYLRSSAAEFFQDPWLMLHEYWHVIGQWEPRELTITGYLAECLRHGYWNNRFEVEARAFADTHIHRFRALLAGGPLPQVPQHRSRVSPAAPPVGRAGRR